MGMQAPVLTPLRTPMYAMTILPA